VAVTHGANFTHPNPQPRTGTHEFGVRDGRPLKLLKGGAVWVDVLRSSILALVLGLSTYTGAAHADAVDLEKLYRPRLVLGSATDQGGVREVGAEGAEWAFPGGGRVIAEPGASIVILKGSQKLNLGDGIVPAYSIALKSGSVRVRVPNPKASALIVAGPRKVIAVVASGEAVMVASEEQIAVANTEGRTMVAVGTSRHQAVEAGTLIAIDQHGPSRRGLLPSPTASGGKNVVLAYDSKAPIGELGWVPVPDAAGYRVELRDAKTNHLVKRQVLDQPRLPVGFATLAPGRYTVRVVSLDRSGVESTRPLQRTVSVVKVNLPEGGYRDETGAVRFPPGTKLSLQHTEGVEMTYGNAQSYFPAPAALELQRAEPRVVRFKSGEDAGGVTLLLLPRSAKAEVEFGPSAPRWPGGALAIRVRLTEPGGAKAPTWIEARPKVTVGVDPVPLAFTRDGDWLTAALPAQTGPGPWVVRVEVADQHGFELGRDFVEVSRALPANPKAKGAPSAPSKRASVAGSHGL
jgi:hypothetical protein